MTETLVYKRGLVVALLATLRLMTPAVVTIGMLLLIARAWDRPFDEHFLMLSVLLAVLSPVVLQTPDAGPSQLIIRRWPTAVTLLVRWAALLTILLLIGYVTKLSSPSLGCHRELGGADADTAAGAEPLARRPAAARDPVLGQRAARGVRRLQRGQHADGGALRKNRELCISVAASSTTAVPSASGLEEGAALLAVAEPREYVKRNAIDVIFIALPMRTCSASWTCWTTCAIRPPRSTTCRTCSCST